MWNSNLIGKYRSTWEVRWRAAWVFQIAHGFYDFSLAPFRDRALAKWSTWCHMAQRGIPCITDLLRWAMGEVGLYRNIADGPEMETAAISGIFYLLRIYGIASLLRSESEVARDEEGEMVTIRILSSKTDQLLVWIYRGLRAAAPNLRPARWL